MKRSVLVFSGVVALAAVAGAIIQVSSRITPVKSDSQGRTRLHNGWYLTPAGKVLELPGDMPGTILALDAKHALVNTCGYHSHSVNVLDLSTREIVQRVDLGRDWMGTAFDPAKGEVYISGGAAQKYKRQSDVGQGATILPTSDWGAVLRLKWDGEKLSPLSPLSLGPDEGKDRYVSAILALPDGALAVADAQNDTIYRLSAGDRSVEAKVKVGYRPYGLTISPDGKTLAVSNWGDKSVSLLGASDLKEQGKVTVGDRPNALAYSKDGRLLVCTEGPNTVDVIRGDRVTETVKTSFQSDDKVGSAPVAIAIDSASGRAYVANAGNNAVAVLDLSRIGHSKVLGFVPTARYPSAIALSPDGRQLLVGTGKVLYDQPNPKIYVGNLLQGGIAFIDVPDSKQLAKYTEQALGNRPTRKVDAAKLAALKGIKHIVYVIRENRTYDQIMGDVKAGNGDPNLTLFGQKITPNGHQLVSDFVLLDNYYVDAEVSQVGHPWTDSAYAADYEEKQWSQNYSGRGEIDSDPRLTTSPGGFIWQNVKRNGKTSRIYGEYVEWQEEHDAAHGAVKEDPEKFGCSAAFEKVFARGGRDTEKTDVFLAELKEAEKSGKWPNFMVIALNEDHTHGRSPGSHTPGACVGSNDLAVGRLIEGISHSKFWGETAIFITEDDAQNGQDHVDCHRSVGMVISPYTRRGGIVDSTPYTTSSMIRTMELLLELPPMTQYDKAAQPMLGAFTTTPDLRPWSAVAPQIDIDAMNPTTGVLAERSKKLDFSDVDRADEQELNAILWEAMKPGKPMPAPVRSYRGR